jgi:hypothetical protein
MSAPMQQLLVPPPFWFCLEARAARFGEAALRAVAHCTMARR